MSRFRLLSYLVVAGLLFPACKKEDPETRVKQSFSQCVQAIEKGDAPGAVAHLDRSFQGPDGMDKAQAQAFLMALFRREKIGITVLKQEVRRQGQDILQSVELFLTSKSGSPLPEDWSRKAFLLRWIQTEQEWKLREIQPVAQSPQGNP